MTYSDPIDNTLVRNLPFRIITRLKEKYRLNKNNFDALYKYSDLIDISVGIQILFNHTTKNKVKKIDEWIRISKNNFGALYIYSHHIGNSSLVPMLYT